MTAYYISSGVTTHTSPITSGNALYVLGGGTGLNILVSGGEAYVNGVMSNTTVDHDGGVSVSAGGSAVDTSLTVNGFLVVDSAGSATGTTLGLGCSFEVLSGGKAYDTVINSGGHAFMVGTESGTKINSSGTDELEYEGVGSAITVFKGGTLDLAGKAYKTLVSKGGSETVYGKDIYGTLRGGSETVYGTTTGTVISSGGSQEVIGDISASITSGSKVEKGGTETVEYNGVASGTKISGGTLDIEGGTASGGINFFGKGGTLVIGAGSTVPDTTISGFVSGDKIDLPLLADVKKVTVSVKKANLVTVSGAGQTYELKIAGAKVGSTAYSFSKGVLTTTVAAATMEFLKPVSADAATLVPNGGTEFTAAPVIASKNAEAAAMTSSQAAYAVGGLVDSENLAHSAALVGLRGDAQKVF